MSYPSEVLSYLVENSSRKIYLSEQKCLEAFACHVRSVSGTLYKDLFSCLQKEPLEHNVLLRTEFLAKSLVPGSFIAKFYEILRKYHYRSEEEILKCMKDIAVWHGEENINFWMKNPWIKEVASHSTSYLLNTTKGDFSFVPSYVSYKEEIEEIKRKGKEKYNLDITKTIPNGYNFTSFSHFDYKCHAVSYAFSIFCPKSYVVTAICPRGFNGFYELHSYNVTEDFSSVVDLSNGIVMPYEDFYRLMQPVVLNQIKGDEIPNEFDAVRSSLWPLYSYTKSIPLKMLAFYHYDMLTEEQREEKYGDLLRNLKKLK